jgi:hypothetical protein
MASPPGNTGFCLENYYSAEIWHAGLDVWCIDKANRTATARVA